MEIEKETAVNPRSTFTVIRDEKGNELSFENYLVSIPTRIKIDGDSVIVETEEKESNIYIIPFNDVKELVLKVFE